MSRGSLARVTSSTSAVDLGTGEDDFDIEELNFNVDDDAPIFSMLGEKAPKEEEFFHGPMGREEAERLLMKFGQVGSYLVRGSVRHPGDYSLSFRVETESIKHFKIIAEMGYFYIGRGCYETLRHVVFHYMTVPLLNNKLLRFPLVPSDKAAVELIAYDTVVCLHDYVGHENEQELSFKRGDSLLILHRDDSGWFWARTMTEPCKEGYIPGTMVTETSVVDASKVPARKYWFHGMISRPEAEDELLRRGAHRSYLMRESEKSPGDISISFRIHDQVKHFRIETIGDQVKFGRRVFASLEEVIARYMDEPITEHLTLLAPLPPSSVSEDTYESVYGAKSPATDKATLRKTQSGVPEEDAESKVAAPVLLQRKPTFKRGKKGKYEKTGAIFRKIKKKWKRMHFALLNSKNLLYIFETETSLRPKGIIDLESSAVHPLHDSFFGRPNCFQIFVKGVDNENIYLCANNQEERDTWLRLLRRRASNAQNQTLDGSSTVRIRSLNLQIKEAKDLPSKASTPYCIISLDNVMQARTQVKPRSAAFWGEDFLFDDLPTNMQSVTVQLNTKNKLLKDSEVSTVSIPITRANTEKLQDVWFHLVSVDGKAKVGQIRLSAKCVDEVVLPLKDYDSFVAALLANDVRAVIAIGSVGKDRDDIARMLLRVFAQPGEAPKFLTKIIDIELAEATDPNTLFRGNSLVSKAMDQYMKLVAMDYMHNAILDRVREVFESKQSCELDPSRLEKGADVKVNMARLFELLDGFWSDIERSVDRCPGELRFVFHHLQVAVSKKFNDPLVKYTTISGFLFLRLFCAAILNPKLFNMMPDHPTEHTARTLTLVAKTLQNLANLTTFGDKETYMKDLNSFLTKATPRMKRFIDDLSAVPELPLNDDAVEPMVTARALAGIHRYCLEHSNAILEYGKAKKQPEIEALMKTAEALSKKIASTKE